MKVNINAVDFTVDQKLVEFIQKKMDKLEKFSNKVTGADVFLKLENTSTKENKIVEIKLNVPGDSFVVKKQSKSFEESFDDCVNPMERFLEKYKDMK